MSYIPKEKPKEELAVQEEDEDPTFDQTPVRVCCPRCGMNVITFIEHEASWVTYAVSIALLMVLNWAALCVVPVVFPLFKDVVHHCPRCLSVLATRSRVVLPKWKDEIMSFRFGSCVVVLARKYVVMLLVLTSIIYGVHWMRTPGSAPAGLDLVVRTPVVADTWEDFLHDCGFKSYLGNPIHVSVAFKEKYKNKTIHWTGGIQRIESGFNLPLLGLNQRGAIFVRMNPAQFPSKRDMSDLVLLYKGSEEESSGVSKLYTLKRGDQFSFDATFVEAGKRGSPHVLALWQASHDVAPAVTLTSGSGEEKKADGLDGSKAAPAAPAGP